MYSNVSEEEISHRESTHFIKHLIGILHPLTDSVISLNSHDTRKSSYTPIKEFSRCLLSWRCCSCWATGSLASEFSFNAPQPHIVAFGGHRFWDARNATLSAHHSPDSCLKWWWYILIFRFDLPATTNSLTEDKILSLTDQSRKRNAGVSLIHLLQHCRSWWQMDGKVRGKPLKHGIEAALSNSIVRFPLQFMRTLDSFPLVWTWNGDREFQQPWLSCVS